MLSSVEIQLPLDFVQEALILSGDDEDFVLRKGGFSPTMETELNMSFVKSYSHLKITFDKLKFRTVGALNQCIINPLGGNISSATTSLGELKHKVGKQDCLSQGSEEPTSCTLKKQKAVLEKDEAIQGLPSNEFPTEKLKRKRGRPRKKNNVNSSEKSTDFDSTVVKETTEAKDISSHGINNAADEGNNRLGDRAQKVTHHAPDKTEESTGTKRYSLRGKKLNSQIMALVKATDDNFGTTEIEDENSIGTCSDEEVNRFKQIEKKMKNTGDNDKESKENKNHIKEIKSKVEEILRSGNRKEKHLSCKICEEIFSGITALHEHVSQEHENSETVREYIQEISELQENLNKNENSCCYCGEAFKDFISLENHQVTTHKETGVKCPLCHHKSKNLAYLKLHIRNMHVEVGKKAFCHLCTASFRSRGSLKQHIDLNHYGNKHVSCSLCKKQFYNKSQLRRHMIAHGLGRSRRFTCEICSKSFSFEYNLKRHNKIVHQPQSECFHCSYCGKGFSQKVPMISHVTLVHFNLFPYSCKDCKVSFLKAALLKEHMQTVHNQTDFEVPILPKNSVYKTAEDKFYCLYCNESFTHKIRLIEHMHGDHADAFPYKCETCVQGFIERSFLVIHMLKAHGVLIQNEDELPKHSESAGEIMQIITTKSGYPNKVVQTASGEEMLEDNERSQELTEGVVSVIMDTSDNEYTASLPPVSSHTSSSLLVEVAQGSNTYQYVIEAPESLSQSGSELAVQDIANLLIAAEKSVHEGQQEELNTEPSSVQEISLVIDDSGHNNTETINDTETVQVLLGQNEENMTLLTADNQGQPMEVSVDQTEQNNAVLTIENQAQTLQIENGDIIELNDSNSDGRNYYRIINVLENH